MSTNTTYLPLLQTTIFSFSFFSFSSFFSILPFTLSTTTILLILTTYLFAVRYLRYSRRNYMIKKFGYTTKESMKFMTNTDAQQIMNSLEELEFPTTYKTSRQFGIFRTYGIPSISCLLVETKQFSSVNTVSKRYADTTVLVQELFSHPPLHPRVLKTIARMNYLHAPYQKAGKLSNDDLLYTLKVYISEPIAWIQKYEWRALNDMEICAISTYWKGIGDAMGISYSPLQSPENNHGQWRDGLDFYADISAWAQRYEEEHMRFSAYNQKTAEALIPLLLHLVPKFLHPLARDAFGASMDPRLRAAMKYADPSPTHVLFLTTFLTARKWILRYTSLPRPTWMRVREISKTDEAPTDDGRFYATTYLVHPFYVKPGVWNRWGPMALLKRALGGNVPKAKGEQTIEWKAEGYRIEEVGPRRKEGKGIQEMKEIEKELMMERTVGCPFAFAGM